MPLTFIDIFRIIGCTFILTIPKRTLENKYSTYIAYIQCYYRLIGNKITSEINSSLLDSSLETNWGKGRYLKIYKGKIHLNYVQIVENLSTGVIHYTTNFKRPFNEKTHKD